MDFGIFLNHDYNMGVGSPPKAGYRPNLVVTRLGGLLTIIAFWNTD
jgi:hypothetical protein